MQRKITLKLLLFFSGFLIALITCEAALRLFYEMPQPSEEVHKLFCEFDSTLGWKKKANFTGKHTTLEYTVVEQSNSKGIRGPEYSYAKKPDEFRILILGDSFAEGYSVEFDAHFAEVLRKKLNKSIGTKKTVQVINAGTGGYSTDQEYLYFKNEGVRYDPDLVILMFFYNDIYYNGTDTYWRGSKPLFSIENGKLEAVNIPLVPPEKPLEETRPEKNSSRSVFKRIKKFLFNNSYLYVLTVYKVKTNKYLLKLALLLGLVDKSGQNDEILTIPDEFRVWEKNYNERIKKSWEITEVLINQLQKETTSLNMKLIIFYVPDRSEIYMKEWDDMLKKFELQHEDWDIQKPASMLGTLCKELNIDFINPTDEFRKEARRLNSKQLYWGYDRHWNDQGHQLAANILYNYIYSHRLHH